MTKSTSMLVVWFIMMVLMQACVPAKPDCASEEIFCVGLVTNTNKIDDKSFNQSAWEGVNRSQIELGTQAAYIESVDVKDYDKNIAEFANENYDVIVTVGSGMRNPTTEAANLYPNIKFIGVDQFQSEEAPGLAGLVFPEDQAGFLAGALAAMMSESHKIGAVCATDGFPFIWRLGEGYKAGAAYIDGKTGITTEVMVVYHSDDSKAFIDPEWGADNANSMIRQGADTIFGCGGLTGNSAIISASQVGIHVIGVDADQYLTLPDAAPGMLSSAMKLITPSVFELIKLSKDGNFPNGNYFGNVGLAPFHELENEVPATTKTALEEITAGLLDGSIKTNIPPEKP